MRIKKIPFKMPQSG